MPYCSTSLSLSSIFSIMNLMLTPDPLTDVEDGWLTPLEQKTLYKLAYLLDGPILEIGAWAGKSTSVIARAVRDSNRPKFFITAEINPSVANYRIVGDHVYYHYPHDSEAPLGAIPRAEWDAKMKPLISRPGGVVSLLIENLSRLNLLRFVNIHIDDFVTAPALEYNFIFNDCMHTPAEIERGAEPLRKLMGNRTVVLAAHDWSEKNEAALRRCFPISGSFRADSLFVCQIEGQPGTASP